MATKLCINSLIWAEALARIPFKNLEMMVSDMSDRLFDLSDDDPTYELYDLLHEAIKNKRMFDECNTEKTASGKLVQLAHELNIAYLRWHPEKRENYLRLHPEYRKEVKALPKKVGARK